MEKLVHDGMESLLRILSHVMFYLFFNSDFNAEKQQRQRKRLFQFEFEFRIKCVQFHWRLPKAAAMYGDFRTRLLHLRQI